MTQGEAIGTPDCRGDGGKGTPQVLIELGLCLFAQRMALNIDQMTFAAEAIPAAFEFQIG